MHNMNTYTPQFRAAVESVAEEIGLLNATNYRHEKNGTIAYIDPVTTAVYTLHTNGYIRRTHRQAMWYNGSMQNVTYQLNRTRKVSKPFAYGDKTGFVKCTERIMATPLEQLALLTTSVISYRKYNGN